MQFEGKQAQVAAVTGATGAIGKGIARGIAAAGCEVVLLCRNEEKARKAALEIVDVTGNQQVRYELVDVSRQRSIQQLAARWQGPLHILINNAAVTPRSRQETLEGIELQFATNVLGYFWMIQAFHPILRESAPVRIVNVASYWAGGLDLDDLEFKRRAYTNGAAYRQSKQADRMLTAAFAGRFSADGITVNACHPGDVNSTLSNNLGFGGHESPDQGARTPLWLAVGPEGGHVTGGYFENMRRVHDPFIQRQGDVDALYQACHSYA